MDDHELSAQLKELDGKLRVRVNDPGKTAILDAQQWKNVFHDITPAEIYRRFAGAAGGNEVKLNITIGRDTPNATINLFHNHEFTGDLASKAKSGLDFIISDGSARLVGADLSAAPTGQSVAKGYMRESAKLFKDIDIKELTLFAERTGGYAWAKYGFQPPTPDRWHSLQDDIARRVPTGAGRIYFQDRVYDITPSEQAAIQAITTAKHPDTLKHLTMLNRVLFTEGDQEITVGKAALIGTKWEASLPLEDGNPAYERFKAYTDDGLARGRGPRGVAA